MMLRRAPASYVRAAHLYVKEEGIITAEEGHHMKSCFAIHVYAHWFG
jgi:hypothetical protein